VCQLSRLKVIGFKSYLPTHTDTHNGLTASLRPLKWEEIIVLCHMRYRYTRP